MTNKDTSRASNIAPQIKALKVGETASFPIEWMDSVRSITSKVNAILGGSRRTKTDTSTRLIYVERIS